MLSREEVLKLAKEVGAYKYENRYLKYEPTHTFTVEQLERFANLVAAQYEQDALRYRWLRDMDEDPVLSLAAIYTDCNGSAESIAKRIDKAVDAAMEAIDMVVKGGEG